MKKGTIKSKIFKFNILTTIATLLLVAIVFNISINYYFQKIAMDQLNDITTQTNKIIIKEVENLTSLTKSKKALVKSFYRMEKSLSKKLSVINAEGFFISSQGNLISLREDDEEQTEIENAIMDELLHSSDHTAEQTATVGYKGIKYATVLMPVPQNKINIQAYVLYASLQKINELKKIIIGMLIIILLIALVISISISSYISKRVSNPLTTISGHLRVLSERNFKTNIEISVDNEIQELVDNINRLAEKLEVFDQSQKKFLEDVSHEFRTPLMIIQSHAEGLKYGVVENKQLANDIIIDETRRLTLLIDDLL